MKESRDILNGIGTPEWRLSLALLVSWLVTYLICAKGVQSSGKASYFLAIFPYVILFALLIRSVTLDGAGKGILYFIQPKWEKLLSAKVSTPYIIFKTVIGQQRNRNYWYIYAYINI